MPKRIAAELVEGEIPSREGVVYLTARYVYKVFGQRTNPYEQLFLYKQAESEGVPVPDTAKFTAQLQEGGQFRSISGLRSERLSGRFFQLSKAGGESILINEINQITSPEVLSQVIAGLASASQIGVTDPQGFINPTSTPPLAFIDLHFQNRPSPVRFQAALEAAKTRLSQLG